jgi:hypothetical protein
VDSNHNLYGIVSKRLDRGAVDLVFAPEGLRCDIEIPLSEPQNDASEGGESGLSPVAVRTNFV